MAFEPVYSEFTPSYPIELATGQAVVEAKLLPAGFSVKKVLSASADLTVMPGEVFTGEARYGGKVFFKVLALDESGICRSLDYIAEFSDKLTGEKISASTRGFLHGTVLDTDIVLASAGEIKLACVVEVKLTGIAEKELRCLTGGGEGVYTHDDRFDYARFCSKGGEKHTFSDKIDIPGVDEVLFCEPKCVLLKRSIAAGALNVKGVIINDITGISGESPVMVRQEYPFEVELVCQDARDDDICTVYACIESFYLGEAGGESSAATCEYNVSFDYCVWRPECINPVCDAFSVTNELDICGETVDEIMPLGDETFFERVEGKITLDDNMPAADRIAAICGSRLSITDCIAGEGRLTCEGMVSCTVVYSSEDGQKCSAAVELPFSITVDAALKESDTVSARGVVTAINVKIKRDGALDIKADIAVEYCACRQEQKYIITSLQAGAERAIPSGAIAIHVARKGETLWDAAKALGTTPENVLLQNPDITLPLSGGERVITYRCLGEKA